MIRKLLRHARRVARARRFGVAYGRRRSFTLPDAIRVGDRRLPLAAPDEHGARSDFVVCVLDDDYGLAALDGPVETVLDVGANVGFFSVAARAALPEATIHAYEPNPRIAPFVEANAAAAAVTLFREAVGAEAGTVAIAEGGDSNQARTVAGGGIAQVSLATAVARLGGRVDLAKIDCEGAEWDLFEARDAWAGIDRVRMEYHLWGARAYADVARALDGLGFEVVGHWPAGEWGTVWARRRR